LRGILVRVMHTAWTWGHMECVGVELRLSLIEGWRGIRLVKNASDMLSELVAE